MRIDKSNIEQFIDGTIMHCSDMDVTEIKFIPESITHLYCSGNQLTSLPKLPDGLVDLSCNDNKLTSLPKLPNGLVDLSCNDNKLTVLPPLPNGLVELSCVYNKLTSLPLLPNLKYLYCFGNQLINEPTYPLSNWIKQHNKSINRNNYLKQLLNENR